MGTLCERRKNMASYEKVGDTWTVRYREYQSDGSTKNVRKSGFARKRDAQDYFESIKSQIKKRNEQINSPAHILFEDMVGAWYDYKRGRTKESSFYTARGKVEKHIVPAFSGRYFDEVTVRDIFAWQEALGASGLSYSYRVGLRGFLASIYKYAARYCEAMNIIDRVEPPRNTDPPREMHFWTREQFRTFIEKVDDPTYALLFRTLYVTGCRKGEAFALTWDDFDPVACTLSISKSITRKTDGGAYAVTTPKNTSSVRTVDFPSSLVSALLSHRSGSPDDARFIFGCDRPLAEKTVTRAFDKAIAAAGVPRIRIHDLRHSCASLLISEGISIVAVSKRLGHKNIEQTLNTYSHMMPRDNEKMLAALEGI